jgi:hypothetical protein
MGVFGAAIAGISRRRGLRLMQQLARGGDVALAVAVGEQAVVADAMKAGGQHVQQEAMRRELEIATRWV